MHLNIKKFGKKKKTLDEESTKLILEVHKEQNLGARRLEKIIEFKRECEPQQFEAQKTLNKARTQAQPLPGVSGLSYQQSRWRQERKC